MLVGSKTTSLLSRQEFQMQNTWELSQNRVLLAFIISVLMPHLMARHVWEGCVCNWTLSQMFKWCLESSQSHLWTRTCLWLWSTGPNLGFHLGYTYGGHSDGLVLSSFVLLNRERDLSCVLSASVHDIYLWQLANASHAFCLTGVVKIAHAHLYYCLILLWAISDQY